VACSGWVQWLEAQGIDIQCDRRLGRDLKWDDLAEYDAVFVSTGAHLSRSAGIRGEHGSGVRPGLEFLHDVNAGHLPVLGTHVAVVGGGNTAMDCARTARRLGSEVTVVYRRTRKEMPAIAEEVEGAEQEGVTFLFQAAPEEAVHADGQLQGLKCRKMEMGPPDDSGRRRPIPMEDGEFFLEVDSLLTAIGEKSDLSFLPPSVDVQHGLVSSGELGAVEAKGLPTLVFAGGDVVEQPRTVAHALGAGKRAALGIDRALHLARGKPLEAWDPTGYTFGPEGNVSITRWRGDDPVRREAPVNHVVERDDLNLNHFTPAPGHADHHLPPQEALGDFRETNQGLTWEEASSEAKRCFNCGVCNSCELCMIFCPDFAISRRADGGFDIDLDYCKGCGICVEECPRGAITMTREGI